MFLESDSESKRLVKLGETLLDQANDSNPSSDDADHISTNKDNLYFHLVQLSNLLKSKDIVDTNSFISENFDFNHILQDIHIIFDDLFQCGKIPDVEVGPKSATYESYRLLSFVLYFFTKGGLHTEKAIPNSSSSSSSDSSIKCLKEQMNGEKGEAFDKSQKDQDLLTELKESYAIHNEKHTKLIDFLVEEFNLQKGLNEQEIIDQIKCSRQDNLLKSNDNISIDSDKIQKLKKKIKNLSINRFEEKDSLQEQINNLLIENNKIKEEITFLNSQNEILKIQLEDYKNSNIKSSSSDKTSASPDGSDDLNCARIFLLQNDLQASTNRCLNLDSKNRKKKNMIKQLNLQNQEQFNKIKERDAKINELHITINRLKIEKDDILSKGNQITSSSLFENELDLKEKENQKLLTALNELSSQFSSINSELCSESNTKNKLYTIIQMQSNIIDKYESLSIEHQSNEKKQKNQSFSSSIKLSKNLKEDQPKCDHSEVTEKILDYSSTKNIPCEINEVIDLILRKNNFGESPISRILSLFDYLIGIISKLRKHHSSEQKADKFLELQNERLISYCSNLLFFLENLANSGEMQSWILDSQHEENFRPLLLSQCSKIDTFLKQNSNKLTNFDFENLIDFPDRINKIINDFDTQSNREIILVLQLCSSANDALRRYADNLNEANHHLIADIQELRYELKQTSDDSSNKIDEISGSLNSRIEEEVKKRHCLELSLCHIMEEVSNASNSDSAVNKIKRILNESNIEIKDHKKSFSPSSVYNRNIEKLNSKNDKMKQKNHVLVQKCSEKEKKIKNLISKNKEIQQNINDITNKMENIDKEKIELQIKFEKAKNKIAMLKNEIQEHHLVTVHQNNANNNAIEQISIEKNKQINEYEKEIESLKQKYQLLINQNKDDKSSLKTEIKVLTTQHQNEIEKLISQNDDIKNKYEPLISDLHNKLNVLRESEVKISTENEKLLLQNQKLKSDLQNAKIELKMVQMKINAAEEKMQREKNLLETQFKMNMLSMETKRETELETEKAEFESKTHTFLVSICERFKEFFDFNQAISEDSVQVLLDNVATNLRRISDRICVLENFSNEINTLRLILGANSSQPIAPIVSKLTKKVVQYSQLIKSIKKERKCKNTVSTNSIYKSQYIDEKASEWEQWAKKLLAIVSDDFSIYQSSQKLQFALEEAVMAGISQRRLLKRLEILRTEKVLFKSGMISFKKQNINSKERITLNALLLIVTCFRRLQKNSGHLPAKLGPFSNRIENIENNAMENPPLHKNYPIIAQI